MNGNGFDALVLTARNFSAEAAERAAETEENRRLLPEMAAKLQKSGLLGIMTAPSLGGQGGTLASHLQIAAVLAEGCGSTGWIHALVGYQNYLIGWFPPEVLDDVASAREPLFTGLVMGPPVTASVDAGGVRLKGRWPYVSGIHFANWLLLSARDPKKQGRVLTCLLPAKDTRIEDDWFMMGLKGTGSCAAVLDDYFVPDDRVLCFREAEQNGVPGAVVNTGPLYSGVPTSTIFALVVAAPAIGLAEAAIAAYEQRLASRTNARMPSSQTEWPSSQARLGRAKQQIAQARRTLFGAAERVDAQAAAGTPFTISEKASYRMDAVESVSACTRIVYELFCDAGTGAAMESSPLQRIFRDIHVLRSHFMIMPDAAAENAGRIHLGLDPKPPFLQG